MEKFTIQMETKIKSHVTGKEEIVKREIVINSPPHVYLGACIELGFSSAIMNYSFRVCDGCKEWFSLSPPSSLIKPKGSGHICSDCEVKEEGVVMTFKYEKYTASKSLKEREGDVLYADPEDYNDLSFRFRDEETEETIAAKARRLPYYISKGSNFLLLTDGSTYRPEDGPYDILVKSYDEEILKEVIAFMRNCKVEEIEFV